MSNRITNGVEEPSAIVVNVQHFSTHDGPGIRSTVFLKGCSLRCDWCCNPESIKFKPELAYNAKACIGELECGQCVPACPKGALSFSSSGAKVDVNRDLCDDCMVCADICPSKSLYTYGRKMTVSEVLAEVGRDGAFYGPSGGGLTISGGECLLQPDFCVALLSAAREHGLSTAIETAGNVPWRFMERVLPNVDVVLHDYKISDSGMHRRLTGADTHRIWKNFRQAYAAFPSIEFIARIPLISGINDTDQHIDAVLRQIGPYPNVVNLELLPYHNFGESKHRYLGHGLSRVEFVTPSNHNIVRLRERIARYLACSRSA